MPDVVLDLETIAGDHAREALAALQNRRLLSGGRDVTPETFGSLCPPLAQVVVIAFLQPKGKGGTEDGERAFFDTMKLPGRIDTPGEPFVGERELLMRAAKVVGFASRLITFNGRHFDLPVLIHRMLANGIRPPALLVDAAREHRYRPNLHVDVLDVMTFHGAAERYSLEAFSIGHGFRDVKEKQTDGSEVAELVRRGETTRVVRHALEDVQETVAHYRRWKPLLEGARERLEA